MSRILFVGLLLFVCSEAAVKRYDGYKLLEILTGKTKTERIEYLMQDGELDVWYQDHEMVHILVPGHKLDHVARYLMQNQFVYTVKIDNVQRDIDEENNRLPAKNGNGRKVIDYHNFNTYDDIMTELDDIAARCPTQLGVLCETYIAGLSYEGRDQKVLRIYREGTGRKAVWLDATIHAREWLSTATHLKIVSQLVDNYATDPEAQRLVDTYDWYLMPVVNPDGYVHTWSSDRLWRKSRNLIEGSPCLGTDLNRNFDRMWGNAGSSSNGCSETYMGSAPGSEPETQTLQRETVRLGQSLITAIHLHTYGQLWLIPWGHVEANGSCAFAADDDEMMVVANEAANAAMRTYNTVWQRGNSCTVLYPASGMAKDYSKAVAGVKYTFTPELRGGSFVVQPSEIEPSFREIWNAIYATIEAIEASGP